jgi:hypothetical protein
MLHKMDPHWLPQLFDKTLGLVVITIAGILWLGAILSARKILAVDV